MIRMFAACLGALMLALSAAPAKAAPPPLSAYGALPAIENIAISKSGQKLAFIMVAGEQRRLVLQEISGAPLGVIGVGDSKVRDIIWAGDEHLVIITSKTVTMAELGIPEREWYIGQSYSLAKKRIINLGAQAKDSLNVMATWPVVRQSDGRWYAYITTYNLVHPIIELQQVLLDDGRTKPIEKMGSDGERWLIDANGVPQARARYNTARGFWSLGVRQGSIWPDVFQVDAKLDSPALVGFGRDGRKIVVAASTNKGRRYLEVEPQSGEATELAPGESYVGLIVDPASLKTIGVEQFDDYHLLKFFDPADQAAWNSVQAAFKGQWLERVTWSDDRKKVVVKVQGASNSGVYYLVDLAAKRADIIGEAYPGVPATEVAEMKAYAYKAADGLEIPGFLTLPPGRAAKNLPLVVLPHGGPAARDTLGFEYWAQAIASRGYAVLQPNFRGSTGHGDEFAEAGYGQWGRKMQTDLSDGVKALAAEGVIDPRRVCIVGASYGGYAALAGVAVQQDVYRCAVAVAGISDLREMLKWEAQQVGKKTETMRYWRRFMGVEKDNDPALDPISPLRNVHKVAAPVLLIHGKDDTVVPFQQSAMFAEALRKAGKPVELVTLKGEDHWMSRGDTRTQMLEASVNFLLRENPPH